MDVLNMSLAMFIMSLAGLITVDSCINKQSLAGLITVDSSVSNPGQTYLL